MIDMTLNALQQFFKDEGHEAKIQEQTQQVYFILKHHRHEYAFFARIFDQSDLLQLLVFIPAKIKPGTHTDLARLLHFLNKELDIPGFGMDETNEITFYRCMLPIPEKKIDPALLKSYLKTMEQICEKVSQPVIAVASGAASYADILEAAKKSGDRHPQSTG